MLLENKNAVIYGAGGAIGGAVAHAFAREGANLFLSGRTLDSVERAAKDIRAAGRVAETAQVDALDGREVEAHMAEVEQEAGSIGALLIEMSLEDFAKPIVIATRTQFLTAGAAARRMVKQGSGVILMITATPARLGFPLVGGFGTACAALEGFSRQLAAELGPQGVRVVCLRSAGTPDAPGVDEVIDLHAKGAGMTGEEFEASLAESTLLRRLPKLEEVGNVAALMASDYASPMTGTVANMTCGAIVD